MSSPFPFADGDPCNALCDVAGCEQDDIGATLNGQWCLHHMYLEDRQPQVADVSERGHAALMDALRRGDLA